jgi:hypothetical protein
MPLKELPSGFTFFVTHFYDNTMRIGIGVNEQRVIYATCRI